MPHAAARAPSAVVEEIAPGELTLAFPRVRLTVPRDWSDESVISFVAPARDGLAANVVVTHEALRGEEWQAHVDEQLRELKRNVRGYRSLASTDLVHRAAPARRVEHVFRSPENVEVRQIQLFVWKRPRLYTASVSHAEGEFEASRASFERILAALEVE